jgi:hypothetical protein
MDNAILLKFVTLTIFSLMFAIGINHSHEQLTSLWRKPESLLRSLLAYMLLGGILAFPHRLWSKRHISKEAIDRKMVLE